VDGGVTPGLVLEPAPGAVVGRGVGAGAVAMWLLRMLAEQTVLVPPPLVEPLH
jgi:hypothetical protein